MGMTDSAKRRLRVLTFLVGFGFVAIGLLAFAHGRYWYFSVDPKIGASEGGTSLGLAGTGLVILVLGFFPWKRFRTPGEKREEAKREFWARVNTAWGSRRKHRNRVGT
jgi:hypothetical protein